MSPQATPQLRKKFPGADAQAAKVLAKNFVDTKGVYSKKNPFYTPTQREWDAIDYMVQEWDYAYQAESKADLPTQQDLIAKIVPHLTLDLAPPNWQRLAKKHNLTHVPGFGCCYPASEVLYYIWGKHNGFKPAIKRNSGNRGDSHWFLRHPDGRIADPTACQFDKPYDYSGARNCGFLTKAPSKRAQVLLKRLGFTDGWYA